MPGESWRYRDMTTRPLGRIRRLEARRQCKRAERVSNLTAPRRARSPKPKRMIIEIKRADLRDQRRTAGRGARPMKYPSSHTTQYLTALSEFRD